jgi:hypothetical protein
MTAEGLKIGQKTASIVYVTSQIQDMWCGEKYKDKGVPVPN